MKRELGCWFAAFCILWKSKSDPLARPRGSSTRLPAFRSSRVPDHLVPFSPCNHLLSIIVDMKASLGLVALSSVLGVVDAQLVWWHRDDEQTYHPPQQTEQPLKELLQNAFDPMPTPPPKAPILQARAVPNNTCGFMRGDPG